MANLTRREREKRAYTLTLATGGFGVSSVVLFITALVGVTGFGLFLLALIATGLSTVALRSTMKR